MSSPPPARRRRLAFFTRTCPTTSVGICCNSFSRPTTTIVAVAYSHKYVAHSLKFRATAPLPPSPSTLVDSFETPSLVDEGLLSRTYIQLTHTTCTVVYRAPSFVLLPLFWILAKYPAACGGGRVHVIALFALSFFFLVTSHRSATYSFSRLHCLALLLCNCLPPPNFCRLRFVLASPFDDLLEVLSGRFF